MLLTIRTTHEPATDLGFLLHKHPAHVQSRTMPFGRATIFYPEASPTACEAAILLEVDPVGLVRGHGPHQPVADQYVNDRPYVASSFLSVTLARMFGSALGGRCNDAPETAARPLPLQARLAALPCRGGEALLRELFEPLGYQVEAVQHPLDEQMPSLGASHLFTVTLTSTRRLSELLTHLYVLVPVLDDRKHYFVGDAEVEKLLKHGEGWLETHPARDQIVWRYLRHRRGLVREALAQLTADEQPDEEAVTQAKDEAEAAIERPMNLHTQRIEAMASLLEASGATRVLDLGCGEGRLLRRLLKSPQFTEIVGLDVSARALDNAEDRLKLDRLPPTQRARLKLLHGSLVYRDRRLAGFDAAAVLEVIEHLDPPRLRAFERVLFEAARPTTIAVTTPNAEYNVKWPSLPAGRFRHADHRFEWTRAELQQWASDVAARHGYAVRFASVGDEDESVGAPTQMAVFTR